MLPGILRGGVIGRIKAQAPPCLWGACREEQDPSLSQPESCRSFVGLRDGEESLCLCWPSGLVWAGAEAEASLLTRASLDLSPDIPEGGDVTNSHLPKKKELSPWGMCFVHSHQRARLAQAEFESLSGQQHICQGKALGGKISGYPK